MFSFIKNILQIKYVIDEIRGGKIHGAVIEILKGLDYSPLYLREDRNRCNDILIFLGLFAARKVIRRVESETVADGILTLPMVPANGSRFFLLLLFEKTSVWNSAV